MVLLATSCTDVDVLVEITELPLPSENSRVIELVQLSTISVQRSIAGESITGDGNTPKAMYGLIFMPVVRAFWLNTGA